MKPNSWDIVGLYLNPPENALVPCVDEKPGIQALGPHAALAAAKSEKEPLRGSEKLKQITKRTNCTMDSTSPHISH